MSPAQQPTKPLGPRPALPEPPVAVLPLPHDLDLSWWNGDVYERPSMFDAFGAPAEDGGVR